MSTRSIELFQVVAHEPSVSHYRDMIGHPKVGGACGLRVGVLAAACAMGVVACSSTVQGSGHGLQTTVAATDSVSAQPTDTVGPTDTATPPATDSSSTSAAPVVAPPPPQCPDGACQQLVTADLHGGFVIHLRSGQATDGSVGASVVELTQDAIPVYWRAVNGETPAHLTCKAALAAPAAPNCVVVDYLGAHASNATIYQLVGATLARGDTVTADSPSSSGRDLNGDGWVDVLGLQNDYTPNYATGHVQWQTWTSNGKHLTSTGCTALSVAPPPQPTSPATGTCAQ